MAKLSDLIISYPDVDSFADLTELVRHAAGAGYMHLEFDIKPDYRDTPRNWQWVLETAFARGLGNGRK